MWFVREVGSWMWFCRIYKNIVRSPNHRRSVYMIAKNRLVPALTRFTIGDLGEVASESPFLDSFE